MKRNSINNSILLLLLYCFTKNFAYVRNYLLYKHDFGSSLSRLLYREDVPINFCTAGKEYKKVTYPGGRICNLKPACTCLLSTILAKCLVHPCVQVILGYSCYLQCRKGGWEQAGKVRCCFLLEKIFSLFMSYL